MVTLTSWTASDIEAILLTHKRACMSHADSCNHRAALLRADDCHKTAHDLELAAGHWETEAKRTGQLIGYLKA